MWLLAALLLFLAGCSTAQDAITGPNMVSGHEQSSLTVQCRYDSSWKDYKKYWCRGADWNTCETLVKTDMEQLVKKDRVSIRDDQTDFTVTVTMEELRISDGGVYWCAIERSGYDPNFKVNVNIDPENVNTVYSIGPVFYRDTSPRNYNCNINNHGSSSDIRTDNKGEHCQPWRDSNQHPHLGWPRHRVIQFSSCSFRSIYSMCEYQTPSKYKFPNEKDLVKLHGGG
ncbi:hypothetical protein ACRRTK_007871 [Alexandromys fortis]